VDTTRRFCAALARLTPRPRVLVCASAIGFYGDRGDEWLSEDSPSGDGFLPELCREWEKATEPAEAAGIRVVRLRIGVVLTAAGGALRSMLPPFRFGFGGRIGTGRQYVSWIGLDDLLGAILHVLRRDDVAGAVNAVAPAPVSNAELSSVLGRVLHRPAVVPVPAMAVRAALGEMADELLLSSTRVRPVTLVESGFEFRAATLEAALRHTLGRHATP
jgi:hypothetical protein